MCLCTEFLSWFFVLCSLTKFWAQAENEALSLLTAFLNISYLYTHTHFICLVVMGLFALWASSPLFPFLCVFLLQKLCLIFQE